MQFPSPPGEAKKPGSGASKWLIVGAVALAVLLVVGVVAFFNSGSDSSTSTQPQQQNTSQPAQTDTPNTSAPPAVPAPPTQPSLSTDPTISAPTVDTANPSTSGAGSTTPTTSASTSASTSATQTGTPTPGTYPLAKNYRPAKISWSYPALPAGWEQSPTQSGWRIVNSRDGKHSGAFTMSNTLPPTADDEAQTDRAFDTILSNLRLDNASARATSTLVVPVQGEKTSVVFKVRDYVVSARGQQLQVRLAVRAMGSHLAAVAYSSTAADFSAQTWQALTAKLQMKLL